MDLSVKFFFFPFYDIVLVIQCVEIYLCTYCHVSVVAGLLKYVVKKVILGKDMRESSLLQLDFCWRNLISWLLLCFPTAFLHISIAHVLDFDHRYGSM